MNIVLEKINIYKNFIDSTLGKTKKEGNNLYILIGMVETYYEFVSEILIPSSSRSKTQFMLLQELKEANIIDFIEFKIMDETRKLKNALTHRLDYMPPISVLYDFNNNCKIENKILPQDKDNQEEIENCILFSVIEGYKIIDAKLFPLMIKELELN